MRATEEERVREVLNLALLQRIYEDTTAQSYNPHVPVHWVAVCNMRHGTDG